MPTYSYACKDCGHAFDIVQSFSDDSLTECPSCQGALRKLFTSVGIVFKGSGFYRNDSRPTSEGSSTTSSDSGSARSAKQEAASVSAPADSGSSSPSAPTTSSSSSSTGAGPAAKAS